MNKLTGSAAWNRARALKLHEHFQCIELARQSGAKVGQELRRVVRILDGMILPVRGEEIRLELSFKTIEREWGYWQNGGRRGHERPEHVRKPESLLCIYKAGCGGHTAIPRELIMEFQRRLTAKIGGRDKHGKAPIRPVWNTICADFLARRPLPGIDYADYAIGAELPWTYSTACRHKGPKTLRQLGNRGGAAHKQASGYVSLDYSKLRRGELYTLDDVRLDIVCIDEATGKATEVVLYVFMEVASRSIVGYVLKPAAQIKQEDVDELLAHMLQVPGYGVGVGYVTHILFERGTTACSEAAQAVLEGVTEGRIEVHRTGMVGSVNWIGAARDRAKGNSCGKSIIETFNRTLHGMLLGLPGQRGMNWENAPASLGALGGANFFEQPVAGKKRQSKQTLIDEAEKLAQFEIISGHRVTLKLPMLRLMELNACVAATIKRYNNEPGHEFRGHGKHWQEEGAPGVWTDTGWVVERPVTSFPALECEPAEAPSAEAPEPAPAAAPVRPKRVYEMKTSVAPEQRNKVYFALWNQVSELNPKLDRFSLTRRALGHVKPIPELTDKEFDKVCRVFKAIIRDAK